MGLSHYSQAAPDVLSGRGQSPAQGSTFRPGSSPFCLLLGTLLWDGRMAPYGRGRDLSVLEPVVQRLLTWRCHLGSAVTLPSTHMHTYMHLYGQMTTREENASH